MQPSTLLIKHSCIKNSYVIKYLTAMLQNCAVKYFRRSNNNRELGRFSPPSNFSHVLLTPLFVGEPPSSSFSLRSDSHAFLQASYCPPCLEISNWLNAQGNIISYKVKFLPIYVIMFWCRIFTQYRRVTVFFAFISCTESIKLFYVVWIHYWLFASRSCCYGT
jgi:hypothetical protein